jgi:hypothetical protein
MVPLLLLLLLLLLPLLSPQPRWKLHMQSYRLPLNSFTASAVPPDTLMEAHLYPCCCCCCCCCCFDRLNYSVRHRLLAHCTAAAAAAAAAGVPATPLEAAHAVIQAASEQLHCKCCAPKHPDGSPFVPLLLLLLLLLLL